MSKIISVAILLAAAGFATSVRAAPQNAPAPQQPAATPSTPSSQSPVKPGDRNCLRDTGSLIPAKKGECLPVTGRSYSKQDIDSTGKTRIGPALQQLDPSITVRGGGH
jgi:hypothetical protein